MWRRLRASLTLRIFLITAALLAAACALTYGMLAYLTPVSYTALLEDELDAAAGELIARLERTTRAESAPELARFLRETGATAQLLPPDEADSAAESATVDSIPGDGEPGAAEIARKEAFAFGGDAADGGNGERDACFTVSSEDDIAQSIRAEDGVAEIADITYTSWGMDATGVAEGVAVTRERRYEFAFRDGQRAGLLVGSGLRAVNRTAEAMRRVLPYLAAALLAFSLAVALLYARFITRPIVEIGAIAGRIANQDFTARWSGRRRDEIGELGRSLNRLSDGLSGALSELQAANAKLRADIERERELERARLAFFSATSHELKTPVTILKGQLSGMLAQVGAYRDREKYLARALDVANRMEALIRQILTVSHLESAPEAGDEDVDLSALLGRQLEQDAELIEARDMRLSAEIAPGVRLRGSVRLLSSALDNVLMNAILYSPPGAEIDVELTAESLRVFNGGARIDAESLARLFEPFYRVERSRSRTTGGSGLGLYLVKRIFDLHGVACEIRNAGGGVEFRARLREESA